jgi:hypothetical protein
LKVLTLSLTKGEGGELMLRQALVDIGEVGPVAVSVTHDIFRFHVVGQNAWRIHESIPC